jgi:hypothetical protein
MLTLFSQVLKDVNVPFLTYKYGQGFRITWFQLFKLFPVSFPPTEYCITLDNDYSLINVLTMARIYLFVHIDMTCVKNN